MKNDPQQNEVESVAVTGSMEILEAANVAFAKAVIEMFISLVGEGVQPEDAMHTANLAVMAFAEKSGKAAKTEFEINREAIETLKEFM